MEKSLTTTIAPDGVCITLTFRGDLADTQIEGFKKDLDEAAQTIAAQFQKRGRKLLVLLDMTDFTGNYIEESLAALVQFAEHNADYVEKTASFGGSDKVKMAGEVAIVLSHRDNIKICDTQEEAMKWLHL